MRIPSILASAFCAFVFLNPAQAQTTTVNPANGLPVPAEASVNPANGAPIAAPQKGKRDCSKAKRPERCELRQKARAACIDKTGEERRQCKREYRKANRPPETTPGAKP